jgi:hypothetical protein
MFPYTPKPQHILLPVAIMLVTAVVTGFFSTWQTAWAFVFISIICLVMGVCIGIAITIEKYSQYWENIGRDIDKLQKTPPELWGTLGFITPPKHVTVSQNVTGEPGESSYLAVKNFDLSLSPEQMQVLANALLTNTKSLAETDWQNTIIGQTKIREVKHEMLRAGLIARRNPHNERAGFMLTERGVVYLYEYASEWVRADASLEVRLSRVGTPALLEDGSLPKRTP